MNTETRSSSETDSPSKAEVSLWAALIVASGLLLPGSGIVIALVLSFTRLREASTPVRLGLVVLGVVILAIQIVGLLGGSTSGHAGLPAKVN